MESNTIQGYVKNDCETCPKYPCQIGVCHYTENEKVDSKKVFGYDKEECGACCGYALCHKYVLGVLPEIEDKEEDIYIG